MAGCCVCNEDGNAREDFAPWPVLQCQGCGLVYLDERADQLGFVADAAGQLQADANGKTVEYWSFPKMYSRHKAVFDGYFTERLERLRQYCPGLKSVLDVGCGFGFFMSYMREHGLETAGLDIEAQSASYAREKLGLDVQRVAFEEYETDEKFDAIVACDVLEHVDKPAKFLAKCKSLLNDGGVIYLQVPNVLGDVLPVGGSFNWPYHIWQFCPATLKRLLVNNTWQVCNWWTGVMGVIGVYEAGGPDQATRQMWQTAANERRGNRLQMLARAARNQREPRVNTNGHRAD